MLPRHAAIVARASTAAQAPHGMHIAGNLRRAHASNLPMRWSAWAGIGALVLVGCEPPAKTQPNVATAARPAAGDSLPGTYRLSAAGAAKVERWAKLLGERSGMSAKIATIEVARAAATDDLVILVGTRGPYTLQPAGRESWTYPLKKGWKVTVSHQGRRARPDVLRVRIGPVSVTYVQRTGH